MPTESRPAGALRGLRLAFALLTRLPVGDVPVGPGDLRRAGGAYPVVGVVVGGLLVGVRAAAAPLVGATAATVLAVLATVVVTGALHEDGLADTVDGLFGGAAPARRLEIMRDSRVGAYGVLALVGTLLLQVSLLAPLSTAELARAALSGHVLSRAGLLVLAARLPAARSEGAGAQVAGGPGPLGALTATAVTAATLAVALGPRGAFALLPAGVALLGVGVLARRRLGGTTGDVLGAAQQLVLLATLAAVAAMTRWGVW